ncbi:Short-chain dehydrogenase [Amycolatopsis xylanica]|uniref:Short-chain dehydrogenase n=1 Tax=Amycolatopsis xylanica TaxID=589385 RepID=A0A1H3N1T9_9PSEU|nr:SDR family oxidoreductase [Amycolatopsis xylanica]SDY82415.1 Short-chain dehydrogenase [Amycolatopsis xylanica]
MRKNIVITGASSGLGEGMARLYAAQGRNLALCARRTDRLDALAGELKPATVVTRGLDVNDHDDVFAAFKEFRERLGGLDRVIVNAGIGKGQPVGTGRFDANKQTLETNFVSALAQCEAALEIFREQNHGHLVVVSSFAKLRGMAGNTTAYAASKAGLSSLADGIRLDLAKTPIKVTALMPGFIESGMNVRDGKNPLVAKAETGAKALVKAIETEKAKAYVPTFPWAPLSVVFRVLPDAVMRKLV